MSIKNNSEIKNKARESYQRGDLEKSEELYNKILSEDAESYEALTFLGIINLKNNNLKI